jgi:hypothetical protein
MAGLEFVDLCQGIRHRMGLARVHKQVPIVASRFFFADLARG